MSCKAFWERLTGPRLPRDARWLPLPPETIERYRRGADARGLSIPEYIDSLVNEDCEWWRKR